MYDAICVRVELQVLLIVNGPKKLGQMMLGTNLLVSNDAKRPRAVNKKQFLLPEWNRFGLFKKK
jgi:hypothetical protein